MRKRWWTSSYRFLYFFEKKRWLTENIQVIQLLPAYSPHTWDLPFQVGLNISRTFYINDKNNGGHDLLRTGGPDNWYPEPKVYDCISGLMGVIWTWCWSEISQQMVCWISHPYPRFRTPVIWTSAIVHVIPRCMSVSDVSNARDRCIYMPE